MGKHVPYFFWSCREIGNYPQAYVQTIDSKHIQISHYKIKGMRGIAINMPRGLARLLAKRINQCLDKTK